MDPVTAALQAAGAVYDFYASVATGIFRQRELGKVLEAEQLDMLPDWISAADFMPPEDKTTPALAIGLSVAAILLIVLIAYLLIKK